jgi:hypothetical protein
MEIGICLSCKLPRAKGCVYTAIFRILIVLRFLVGGLVGFDQDGQQTADQGR